MGSHYVLELLCQTLLHFFCIKTSQLPEVLAFPTLYPSVVVKVGDSGFLRCPNAPNNGEVTWTHCSVGSECMFPYPGKHVYYQTISPEYSEFGFQAVKGDVRGVVDLRVVNVSTRAAGLYTCEFDEEKHASINLIVLETDLWVELNMKHERIWSASFTCGVTCVGNIHSELEWRRAGDNETLISNYSTFTSGNTTKVSSTVEVPWEMASIPHVCQIAKAGNTPYNVTVDVSMFSKSNGDRITSNNSENVKNNPAASLQNEGQCPGSDNIRDVILITFLATFIPVLLFGLGLYCFCFKRR